MNYNWRKPLFITGCLLGCSSYGHALEKITDPADAVRRATVEAMEIVYAKPADRATIAERTKPVMDKYFDFVMLTRKTAGPKWSRFNAEQQERTTTLLTQLAVRSYCSHFDPVVRSEVTYLTPLILANDRREERTLVTYYGQNYTVNYRAEKVDGSWHFYDVIVEGVSLVANYRAQFDSLVERGGPEAVIRALEQSLAQPLPTR